MCVPGPVYLCVCVRVCVLKPHAESSFRAPWAGNKAIAMPTMLSLSSFSLQLKVGNFSCLVYLNGSEARRTFTATAAPTATAARIAIMQIRMADYQITNCNGCNCFVYGWHMACQRQVGRQIVTANKKRSR